MTRTMFSRKAPQSHTRRGIALLLACALLWAQLLGLAHRVVHAPAVAGAPAAQAAQVDSVMPLAAGPSGLLGHLFSPAKGDAECRAYDQLGLSDALPLMPVLALPEAAPMVVQVAAAWHACRTRTAIFEARGPPDTR